MFTSAQSGENVDGMFEFAICEAAQFDAKSENLNSALEANAGGKCC
jgi:hypothetical protein